jgi:GntR family transcriptional regulator
VDRPEPRYLRLAERIVEDIAGARLKPGDRLPTEAQLCARHRVSRITVRHALELVRRRGLIERVPGVGTFVTRSSSMSVWTISSTADYARNAAESDLHTLDWRRVAPPPDVRRFFGSGERLYRLRAVRRRSTGPLYYVEVYVPLAIGQQLSEADLGRATVLELLETKLGITVAGGTEEISAGLADHALARRLRVPHAVPVLILDVLLHGADGRPLEYAKAWYRADQFRRRNQVDRVR